MFAARPSHVPSCDLLPARGRRRRLSAWVPVLALAVFLPGPADAQNTTAEQRLRANGLSLIEGLLTDTINEAITVTVRAVNTENIAAQEADRTSGDTPELRYVIRSSGRTQARGIFLEDYGVVFTVQVPNLTYSHAALLQFDDRSAPRSIGPASQEMLEAEALAQEFQIRGQMSRMGYEIESLTNNLQNEIAVNGATSANAQKLRATIAELQSAWDEYTRESAATTPTGADDREARARVAASPRLSTFAILANASPEAVASAEALANQQKQQVEGAVISAVVDSLSYGHVLHGMSDTDRLAVVLLPSSYLNQVVSWMPANRRDEEFIISVAFRDVRALADGNLPAEEFGGKIRVESRLGQPAQR